MTLATVAPDGRPQTHTVEYAPEGATVYFCTMRTTRKAMNIAKNPNVAYSVDEDYEDWMKIQGVQQMEGRAKVLSDLQEIQRNRRLSEEVPPGRLISAESGYSFGSSRNRVGEL